MITQPLTWEQIKLTAGAPEMIGNAPRLTYPVYPSKPPKGIAKPLAWWERVKTWVILIFTFGFIGFMLLAMCSLAMQTAGVL